MRDNNLAGDNYYLEFENRFRGSREEIISRLSIYEGMLLALAEKSQTQPQIIDIGCGRGEWLEFCRQYDVQATGVDFNASMVMACQKRGLTAKQSEGTAYLSGLPENSCTLISLFHVIEHISHDHYLRLVDAALKALKPCGILLMETPSIDNLIVSSKGFYADPSHVRPVHPETTCFELTYRGYSWAKPFYVNGLRKQKSVGKPRISGILAETALDVVMIAQKTGEEGQLNPEDDWSRELGGMQTTLEASISYDIALENQLLLMGARLEEAQAKAEAALSSAESAHRAISAILNSRIWRTTTLIRKGITTAQTKRHALTRWLCGDKSHH